MSLASQHFKLLSPRFPIRKKFTYVLMFYTLLLGFPTIFYANIGFLSVFFAGCGVRPLPSDISSYKVPRCALFLFGPYNL